MVNNESIFSIGDLQQPEKGGCENSDTHFSCERIGESSNHAPRTTHTPHVISKSLSLPNIFGGCLTYVNIVPRATSCEDLNVLYLKRKEMLVHNVGKLVNVNPDDGIDDSIENNEKTCMENPADDGWDSYNYVGSVKDWIIPVMDEVNTVKTPRAESAVCHWDELPSKDFRIKRIEEWVMDLQHCKPLEEKYKLSTSSDYKADAGTTVIHGLTTARQGGKITPGMEAAKRYISSLSATATAAQLANHGLVVIPFLSAFDLRELTRLHILDLSYNRILRIGHGLASCSSLKELYLAGNKISEVEGLHRLLKLNVLDIQFNKISMMKCLGQLAANYNSLQAISLEGNPAQKNVGDEQLKKYLQSLLPHLAYFNRQSIKSGALKDSTDRSA